MKQDRSITLNNGASMPLLGFGTSIRVENVDIGNCVKKALEVGYRHIDCAYAYKNESEIGKAFNLCFSTGIVKREDVFITSKLHPRDYTNIRAACELCLKNLQIKYLDLYLIHNGVCDYTPELIKALWNDMEKLVEDGQVKSIGISNFSSFKVENLLKCPLQVRPVCNQVELHPYLPQHGLIERCQKENIVMVAYSPLGCPDRCKDDEDPILLDDSIVKSIAEEREISPAQVLIAYGIERNTVVLVKSVNESRIKENFESLNVKLNTDDMIALNSITKRHRYFQFPWALKPGESPEDLWDGEFYG